MFNDSLLIFQNSIVFFSLVVNGRKLIQSQFLYN